MSEFFKDDTKSIDYTFPLREIKLKKDFMTTQYESREYDHASPSEQDKHILQRC